MNASMPIAQVSSKLLVAFALACGSAAPADEPLLNQKVEFSTNETYDFKYRMWTDFLGEYNVEAKFDRFLPDGMVRLRRVETEEPIDIKIKKLSKLDQTVLDRIRESTEEMDPAGEKARALRHFTRGLDKFVQAVLQYRKEREKLGVYFKDHPELTTYERKKKSDKVIEEYWKKVKGIKVNWHVKVTDVGEFTGSRSKRLKVDIVDAISDESCLVRSDFKYLPMPKTKHLLRKWNKGDVVRVSGVLRGGPSRNDDRLTFTEPNGKSYSLEFFAEDARLLTDREVQAVPLAKKWMSQLGKPKSGTSETRQALGTNSAESK